MPDKKIDLEICVFSLTGAKDAVRAGADRLELCAGHTEGGITPNYAFIKKVLAAVPVPVYPIIRPRGGGFCYDDDEFDMMRDDVVMCKELGCKGVTFSILRPDRRIDSDRTAELVALASPMEVTFVRGFDLTPDPYEALEALKQAGCKRVLTSGQAYKAPVGVALLRKLRKAAGDEISIMPGAGINDTNLDFMIRETGAHEFHASAKRLLLEQDPVGDSFGFGKMIGCDTGVIRRMKAIIDECEANM